MRCLSQAMLVVSELFSIYCPPEPGIFLPGIVNGLIKVAHHIRADNNVVILVHGAHCQGDGAKKPTKIFSRQPQALSDN